LFVKNKTAGSISARNKHRTEA